MKYFLPAVDVNNLFRLARHNYKAYLNRKLKRERHSLYSVHSQEREKEERNEAKTKPVFQSRFVGFAQISYWFNA